MIALESSPLSTAPRELPAFPLTIEDSVAACHALFGHSAETLLRGAQMFVRLVRVGDTTPEEFTQRYPGQFTPGFIDVIFRIGEGSMRPELVFTPCPAHAILSRAAYEVQTRTLAQPLVDVIIDAETGDVLRVPLTAMNAKVAQQAVTRTGIRSRDEQLAWLKRRRIGAKPAPVADSAEPWIVRKDHVEILREHTRLSKQDLLRLLSQIN